MRSLRTSSRRALAALLLSGSSACLAGLPPRPATAPMPAFDPTRFFAGRTHGEGTLDVRVGKDRTLRVEGTGRTEADGRFRLDQTVTYGDGTTETRRWLLERVDSTHFSATLSDARGEVRAESIGNRFHLRYLIRQPAVYMEQWLYLQPDGRSVANLAQVTVLGVPWARLAETITRVDATP
jgi:Protein of unknown function (DUF3833)